jgi:hypothetical protein
MTCDKDFVSIAIYQQPWDYPTQDIAETAPSKAIWNTAPPTKAKPSPDVTDLLASRATKLHRHNGLARKRYLAVCESLANGGYSTDDR